MNYNQITCQFTGKNLKPDEVYKIRNNENCVENVVSICKNCPYSHSKHHNCKNCYGTIVQNSVRQLNEETSRIRTESVCYRNTFEKVGEDYIDFMDADEFMDNIDIIANLNNLNWNNGQRVSDKLTSYNSPSTSKTDCIKCRKRCHDKGELTACEKAQKYCEDNGINLKKAPSDRIARVNLPQDCICKEQVPQIIYV